MEQRIFTTVIKSNHKLGHNDYIRGKISGIQFCMCEAGSGKIPYANRELITGDVVLTVECTENQYDVFAKLVNKLYPDLCEFDV